MRFADRMGLPRRVQRRKVGEPLHAPFHAPVPPAPFTRDKLISGLREGRQGSAEQYAFELMGIAEEEMAAAQCSELPDLFMSLKPEGLPSPEEYRVWVRARLRSPT